MRMNKNDFILYEIIDLTKWKKKPRILMDLLLRDINICDRSLRALIEYNNKLFNEHLRTLYIAHSNQKGYIATDNPKVIEKSIEDNYKRSMTMLKHISRTKKAINENYNLKLELEKNGLIDKFNVNEVINIECEDIKITGIIVEIDKANEMYKVVYLFTKHEAAWFRQDYLRKVKYGEPICY